jgi:hypothetical protein
MNIRPFTATRSFKIFLCIRRGNYRYYIHFLICMVIKAFGAWNGPDTPLVGDIDCYYRD